jgi:cell shape-determining protein MreC
MFRRKIARLRQWIFIGLLLCGLALLCAPRDITSGLQFAFIDLFDRPLALCQSLTASFIKDKPSGEVVSLSKYVRLRNHLANNLQLLGQERQKVQQLSGLSDRFPWKGAHFALAGVISSSMDASRGQVIIDRGTADGLSQGAYVLGNESVIGTISELDDRTARVRLITDPSAITAVELADTGFRGVMHGQGNNSAKIQLLPAKQKLDLADVVYVRKAPGLLDHPVIAATVSKCQRDPQNPLFWDVTVEPACDIQSLQEVVVVIMNPQTAVAAQDK